jgi:class 3 adenylate cyclase
MILGIVGYAERLSSTVMSDAVNLASRLENLTKKYECDIIVSEDLLQNMSTADAAELNLRLLDSVVVRGRNSMVTIYQVMLPAEQQLEGLSAS